MGCTPSKKVDLDVHEYPNGVIKIVITCDKNHPLLVKRIRECYAESLKDIEQIRSDMLRLK